MSNKGTPIVTKIERNNNVSAGLNQQDEYGSTALIDAVKLKKGSENVKDLLACPGIDVNATNHYGKTALMVAAGKGRYNAVKLLLACPEIDVNAESYNGDTALLCACSHGHSKIVNKLLACPSINVNWLNEHGQTALIRAVASGHIYVVELLLACPKLDVNTARKNKHSALTLACVRDNKIVKSLLAVPGIDVNWQGNLGQTALMIAIETRRVAITRMLLLSPLLQADLEDENGRTALTIAAADGSKQMIDLLLNSHKVNVNYVNKNNQTALEMAKNSKTRTPLRAHGAASRVPGKGVPRTARATSSIPVHRDQVIMPLINNSVPKDSTVVGGPANCANLPVSMTSPSPVMGTTNTVLSANPACISRTTVDLTDSTDAPSLVTDVAATESSNCIAAAVAVPRQPASWLVARLLMSGLPENLALDCEQKLVYTEGFSNVNDFAECTPAEISRDYLTSIGISGLGTQRMVLRLHIELHNVCKQNRQPSALLPATLSFSTPSVSESRTTERVISAESKLPPASNPSATEVSGCSNSNGSLGGGDTTSQKRSREVAFGCDTSPTEHAFVPKFHNK